MNLSPDILRVLNRICDDNAMEKGDWRKRLALHLRRNPDTTLVDILKGVGTDKMDGCLYQLLQLVTETKDVLLSRVVDPCDIGLGPLDYTLPFHLAVAVSALAFPSLVVSPSLPEHLCDSYASWLVRGGSWEWAVFATLFCVTGEKDTSVGAAFSKQMRAKELVCRYYNENDPSAKSQRIFLTERIGIPSAWLAEASALRSGYEGDIDRCIEYMAEYDTMNALSLLEEFKLPALYFLEDESSLREVSARFGDEAPESLTVSLYRLFVVESMVSSLSSLPVDQGYSTLQEVLPEIDRVENVLRLRRLQLGSTREPQSWLPVDPIVSLPVLLSSALERLRKCKIQALSLLQQYTTHPEDPY